MGLRIWLPLLNNLDNKGISNFNITSVESSPTYVDGKIGKCYQRANSSSQLTNGLKIDNNLVDLFGSTASVTVWVKPLGTHTHYNGTILSSGNWNARKWAFGVSQDNTKVDVLCGSYNNYITCAVPINEWTHLASIYDNGVCTLYKNGIYIGQLTGQAAFVSDANWTGVGRETYAGGYFGFNGCIADLRVFDHCLSAAEVREISQGLILHYKLNDAPILCKTNLTTWSKESGVTSTAQDNGSVKIDCTAKTSSRWGIYCDIQNVLPNTPYTFSVDCKTAHVNKKWQLSVGCNPVPSGTSQFGSNRATMNSTSGFTTYTATVTTNADTTWIRFYLALSCSSTTPEYQYAFVKNVKMTIGTSLQTTIQDSSGYSHHGTVTGIVEAQTDTKRYNKSAYINGSSYILTPAGSFAWNDLTQLTFSAWMKPTASMTGWRGSVGIAADSNQTARGIAITDYGNEFRGTYTNGSGYVTVATGKTLTQNEWHHCAGTLNGTEFKLYFDGALVKTQTIDWGTATLNANARFEVGVDLPGTDEKFTGNYSDVRCYCTALDADAIRQLYEVGAKVDNKGNLHAFEFIETEKNQITKTGQVKNKLISEFGNMSYLKYDTNVYFEPDGSCWVRVFHHNNPASVKFANNDTFTTSVYKDADRWFNFELCNYATKFEFLSKVKLTDTGAEKKYRWIQSGSPLTISFEDSKVANVTRISTDGYTLCPFGGLYHTSGSAWLATNNGTASNWMGATGCWAAWNGGIPGWEAGAANAVKTGSIDIYLRIDNDSFTNAVAKNSKNNIWTAAEFIEL